MKISEFDHIGACLCGREVSVPLFYHSAILKAVICGQILPFSIQHKKCHFISHLVCLLFSVLCHCLEKLVRPTTANVSFDSNKSNNFVHTIRYGETNESQTVSIQLSTSKLNANITYIFNYVTNVARQSEKSRNPKSDLKIDNNIGHWLIDRTTLKWPISSLDRSYNVKMADKSARLLVVFDLIDSIGHENEEFGSKLPIWTCWSIDRTTLKWPISTCFCS